jgi:hypothetical protein
LDYLERFVYHGRARVSRSVVVVQKGRSRSRDLAYKWQHHASRYAREEQEESKSQRERGRDCYSSKLLLGGAGLLSILHAARPHATADTPCQNYYCINSLSLLWSGLVPRLSQQRHYPASCFNAKCTKPRGIREPIGNIIMTLHPDCCCCVICE